MKEINYIAPINTLSYGLVGLNVLLGLNRINVKTNWFALGGGCDAPKEYEQILIESYNRPFNINSTSLRIFHENFLAEHIGRGKHIGWPIFEVNKFSGHRMRHMLMQDEIVVCSKWAKKVCEANGLTQPIHVAPLGVDTNVFYPQPNKSKDELVFIHIGKREYRKSQYEILKCFEKAFGPKDRVKLIICWGSLLLKERLPVEWQKWTDTFKLSKMADKIEIIEWLPSQADLVRLLNSADCGLFLSKAEGFNLGCLESLACGLQNITLNYSGPTEFSSNENSLLVEPTDFEEIYDGIWFQEPDLGTWASFGKDQEEQTIFHMRYLYERKMNGDNLYNQVGIDTANKFTWENTVNKLLKVI